MAGFIAHQGGWDEIILVAGPLLVFAAVLYLANRRANAKLALAVQSGEHDEPDESDELNEHEAQRNVTAED